MGRLENKYKFNEGTELEAKEFSDGSGLEWYSTTYRCYDPQIGRFFQIDPLADLSFEFSSYSYSYNNPMLFNDPSGLFSDSLHPQELTPVVVTAKVKKLQGGDYNGKMLSDINEESFSRSGYSRVVKKTIIPAKTVEDVFKEWQAQTKALSKGLGVAATVAGGSPLDLKSFKDYKEILKDARKKKIPGFLRNPALAAVTAIMGIRAGQLDAQTEKLAEILSDYNKMNANNGTAGKGIVVISENIFVGSMGGTASIAYESYYDIGTRKLIGSTREYY